MSARAGLQRSVVPADHHDDFQRFYENFTGLRNALEGAARMCLRETCYTSRGPLCAPASSVPRRGGEYVSHELSEI